MFSSPSGCGELYLAGQRVQGRAGQCQSGKHAPENPGRDQKEQTCFMPADP